jgi:hypothetical protein
MNIHGFIEKTNHFGLIYQPQVQQSKKKNGKELLIPQT